MENFRLKKYYTCMVVAILIIAIAVSLGTYKLKLDNTLTPVKSDNENIQEIEDLIDDADDEESATPTTTVKKYSKATAFNCVSDAIKQLESSKGYKAIFQTNCKVYVGGIEFANQIATEEYITSGKYHLKTTIATCDSSFGQNYYRYFYSDNNLQSIEYKRTKKFSIADSDKNKVVYPDWSGTDINVTTSLSQIKQKYDRFPGILFTILPTQKSAITSFDKISDSKYYIIKFSLSPNEIPEAYLENVRWQGELVGAIVKTMSFSFYIEKSTLNLRRVKRVETYEAQRTESLSGDCKLETTITFPTINKEIIPEKPIERFMY